MADPVGVAGEIGEDSVRPGEGALGVDEPSCRPQRRQGGVEGLRIDQVGQTSLEVQLTGRVRCSEPLQEQSAEQFGQHPHRQEEAGLAVDPPLSIQRYAAAGHDHMYMGMV